MAKNMGTADRVIRILLALAIVGLLATGRVSGIAAIVLVIVAAMFLVTGLAARCPGYVPFRINTAHRRTT